MYLLGGKKQGTHERVDKASNETIYKAYAKYKKHEINKCCEKNGKASAKHVISLYASSISQVVKIREGKKITARYWERSVQKRSYG